MSKDGERLNIQIEELDPKTRDWILARSASTGLSVNVVIEQELNQRARADGFLSEAEEVAEA